PGQPQLQAELYGVVGGIFADMGAYALAAEYATRQIEALTTIDAARKEQAKAMLLLAQALLSDKHVGDARVRAERALALAEPYADVRPAALVLLARVLSTQGDIDAARRILDRADRDFSIAGKPTAAAARAAELRADFLVSNNRF